MYQKFIIKSRNWCLHMSLLNWSSMVKKPFGCRGMFFYNTSSGHWAKLEERLSGAVVFWTKQYIYDHTLWQGTQKWVVLEMCKCYQMTWTAVLAEAWRETTPHSFCYWTLYSHFCLASTPPAPLLFCEQQTLIYLSISVYSNFCFIQRAKFKTHPADSPPAATSLCWNLLWQ